VGLSTRVGATTSQGRADWQALELKATQAATSA